MTHSGPAKERGTSKASQASDEEEKKRQIGERGACEEMLREYGS